MRSEQTDFIGRISVKNHFIQGLMIDWKKIEADSYLRKIEAIKDVRTLDFNKSVTFFVGENGSGKSDRKSVV